MNHCPPSDVLYFVDCNWDVSSDQQHAKYFTLIDFERKVRLDKHVVST